MNILIIIGNPKQASLSHSIANAIVDGDKNTNNFRQIDLSETSISFTKIPGTTKDCSYILKAQEDITWAQKIIFIFPIWWSLFPAVLKGFIDEVFLPDFAFKYEEGKLFPQGLLKGKSAHIITTSDSPNFYRRFILGDPAVKALKRDTLAFCGFQKIKVTRIPNIRSKNKSEIENELDKIKKLPI